MPQFIAEAVLINIQMQLQMKTNSVSIKITLLLRKFHCKWLCTTNTRLHDTVL